MCVRNKKWRGGCIRRPQNLTLPRAAINCRAIAAELNTGSLGSCILCYASPNRVNNLFSFPIFGPMIYSVKVMFLDTLAA